MPLSVSVEICRVRPRAESGSSLRVVSSVSAWTDFLSVTHFQLTRRKKPHQKQGSCISGEACNWYGGYNACNHGRSALNDLGNFFNSFFLRNWPANVWLCLMCPHSTFLPLFGVSRPLLWLLHMSYMKHFAIPVQCGRSPWTPYRLKSSNWQVEELDKSVLDVGP